MKRQRRDPAQLVDQTTQPPYLFYVLFDFAPPPPANHMLTAPLSMQGCFLHALIFALNQC